MSIIYGWAFSLFTKLAERTLQPSSFLGYANAFWTWLNWVPNTEGIALTQQVISIFVSILFFLINEKPWTKAA